MLPPLRYGSRSKNRSSSKHQRDQSPQTRTVYANFRSPKQKGGEVFNLTEIDQETAKKRNTTFYTTNSNQFRVNLSSAPETRRKTQMRGQNLVNINSLIRKTVNNRKQSLSMTNQVVISQPQRNEQQDIQLKQKRHLIDLHDQMEREKMKNPQPGNIQVKGFGFKQTPYYKILKQEQKVGQKPKKKNFHQQIKIDIQFLRSKFRNFQKSLYKTTAPKLSNQNKQNFKKVLNKILDMSEMSFDRQMQNVKLKRKFKYPFLDQSNGTAVAQRKDQKSKSAHQSTQQVNKTHL